MKLGGTRRQVALLAVLLVVLVLVVMYTVVPTSTRVAGGAPPPQRTGPGTARGTSGGTVSPPPDLGLERLGSTADVAETGRNPFRMGAAAPPPSEASAGGRSTAGPVVPAAPAGPPGPPPPPPIPYKFIGILNEPRIGRVAVLTDGKTVVHGRENQIVEGRYRILKIGEESIQVERVDGSGRQTIPLSGAGGR